MIFERYESYKDSGVEWLGEIPSEWGVKRIKDIFIQISEKSSNLESSAYIPLENIESFTGKLLRRISNEEEETLLFKKNDILFNKLRPYLAKVLLAEFDGGISQEAIVMRLNNKVKNDSEHKYYMYKLLATTFISYVDASTDGVKMPRANPNKIFNIPLSIPNFDTQTQIVTYLDQKTQTIDQEISLLKQKIATYKELKQTLINETVLRGLDKSVKLKDSGLKWIGEVPEHWEIQRIGTAFEERSEKVSDIDYSPLSVTKNGIVPQLANVAKTIHNDNRKLVIAGDFVINSRSDRRGSSGVAETDGSVSVINIVLAPKKTFHGKYLHHMFRSYAFIEEFFRHGRGIAFDLWTTKYSVMKSIEFGYPEIDEQIEIANYLDEKTMKIDKVMQVAEEKITLLKEFRKTLINDAVTGKIKVAS